VRVGHSRRSDYWPALVGDKTVARSAWSNDVLGWSKERLVRERGTVLVTSRSFSSGSRDLVGELRAADLEVVRGPPTHDLAALRRPLATAVAWIAGTGPVTERHLAEAPRLRVVARYGVGVEAVDLVAATARGVVVTNTPGANSAAVAEHALALLLARLREVVAGDRRARTGDWTVRHGRELGSLTVGLLGFGRIGHGLAQRLAGFGATVLAHDPYVAPETIRSTGAQPAAADELPSRCDAVSLHAPGGSRVVDAAWLQRARPGLIIVNTARADLVDEHAVADALRTGRIGGYAADVLSAEAADTTSPLLADDLADLVVITPHAGAQTLEAVDRMGSAATADVLAVLGGTAPAHPVDAPEQR
jgi:D-3-phosphoglycerate dehydrogenase